MNSTYEVRLTLVYTYEYFCNFFCSIQQKKHQYPPPPSTPRTKRHLLCNGEKVFVAKSGIYIYILYAQHAPKSKVYFLSFVAGYPSLNDL